MYPFTILPFGHSSFELLYFFLLLWLYPQIFYIVLPFYYPTLFFTLLYTFFYTVIYSSILYQYNFFYNVVYFFLPAYFLLYLRTLLRLTSTPALRIPNFFIAALAFIWLVQTNRFDCCKPTVSIGANQPFRLMQTNRFDWCKPTVTPAVVWNARGRTETLITLFFSS